MIKDTIKQLHQELPLDVTLVAVSKFHPMSKLKKAYDAGQRIFGESRVQELLTKIPEMPEDVKWHFIGHLQTNKVRQLIGKVALIESVDSEKLIDLIDSESKKKGVVTNVLMQLHVAEEETKFGFTPDELLAYFENRKFEKLTNTHICGVMGMASNVDDDERIRTDFRLIYQTFRQIRDNSDFDLRGFDSVSMGMSGDYKIAIEEGSTLVRIGSSIFGNREY